MGDVEPQPTGELKDAQETLPNGNDINSVPTETPKSPTQSEGSDFDEVLADAPVTELQFCLYMPLSLVNRRERNGNWTPAKKQVQQGRGSEQRTEKVKRRRAPKSETAAKRGRNYVSYLNT